MLFLRCTLIVALATFCTAPLWAQGPVEPTPEHKMLAEAAGEWNAEMKMSDGSTVKCEASFKSICGGLWLSSTFKGDFGGLPFEGHGVDGYDTDKKKFVGHWFDSMTTSPMKLEGSYDEKTKTITQVGEGKGEDGKPATFKSMTTYEGKDKMTFKMFTVAGGKDELMMTVVYTRKK